MDSEILKPLDQRAYFFDQGLRFECRRCGDCCVGAPGSIYVARSEVSRIAAYIKMPEERFIADWLYPFKDSYSIREDQSGRCLCFDNGCRIYPVRPLQCRTFPFWFGNLRSRQQWERIHRECPGIGLGPRYSRREILKIARTTMHF